MIKTRTWTVIIAILLAVSALLSWLILSVHDADTAEVYLDGTLIRSIDLSLVTGPETYTVRCDAGENTILIEPGRICVSDADCPDKVCVKSGWLTGSAPIVCLPHRLVIKFASSPSGTADAISR